MKLLHFYRSPALSGTKRSDLLSFARRQVSPLVTGIETEYCYKIEVAKPLTAGEIETLRWLLAETFEPDRFAPVSFLGLKEVLEAGPRMNFTTAWSTNAVSVCHACGLKKIRRIERSRRYRPIADRKIGENRATRFLSEVHDRMTECPYPEPLSTFETGIRPEACRVVPLIEEGFPALQRINGMLGLGLDAWDVEY